MKYAIVFSFWILAMPLGSLLAQDRIYEPLPQPLVLPPGLVQTLPLNETGSFFGDAFRVVDCTKDDDLPFGACGDQFFGGSVIADTHLEGSVTIQFHPPVNNVSHFEVTHGVLVGDNNVAIAPYGFEFPMRNARVADSPLRLSSGDLNLVTGAVTNIKYEVEISVSGLEALHNVNPDLEFPAVVPFPGVAGHAWIRFEQRPDGLLDFTFQGSTFLPFGKALGGKLVRFIVPLCDPEFNCASVLARGTSAHPHLYLSTKEPEGEPCGNNCPDIPFNTTQEFIVSSYASSIGDDFDLDTPFAGGTALAKTHLQGRMQIQFGPKAGDTVYFVINSLVPEALLAEPPEGPISLPGLLPSLIGQEEVVDFPNLSYRIQRFAVVDDPFNVPQGAINLKTGRVIGEMNYPAALTANIPESVFLLNPGRVPFPFQMVARKAPAGESNNLYALFEKGPNGQTTFRFSGDFLSTLDTFLFPHPDFNPSNAFFTGRNASLDIFLRLQAARPADTPVARKTGGAANQVSSVGDLFSYTYSIPCSPVGEDFAFEYTNQNPGQFGGTFRMNRLAAVKCTNSPGSTLAPGDYDTITFSGFGTWSKDEPDSAPRFTTVQVSTAPDAPYVGILVYQNPDEENNVILSGAHIIPETIPLP